MTDKHAGEAMGLPKFPAEWTYEHRSGCYYFAPTNRTKPPYRTQRLVEAVVDIASDGSLAGVELGVWGDMPAPPPPKLVEATPPQAGNSRDEVIAECAAIVDAEYNEQARLATFHRTEGNEEAMDRRNAAARCASNIAASIRALASRGRE